MQKNRCKSYKLQIGLVVFFMLSLANAERLDAVVRGGARENISRSGVWSCKQPDICFAGRRKKKTRVEEYVRRVHFILCRGKASGSLQTARTVFICLLSPRIGMSMRHVLLGS
jgi:hypothetical protein